MRPVRAVGTVSTTKRRLTVVTMRSDGYIEELFVNKTGQHVHAGEPLFRVYSAAHSAGADRFHRRHARAQRGSAAGADAERTFEGAMQRLRNLGVPREPHPRGARDQRQSAHHRLAGAGHRRRDREERHQGPAGDCRARSSTASPITRTSG